MPLYDYACPDCGTHFEARHGFNDPAPACPGCASAGAQRVITRAPLVAKGMAAAVSKNASKDELRDKWAEETPKLRRQLAGKLGEDAVNKYAPTLNTNYE